jgi:hypothetical protein
MNKTTATSLTYALALITIWPSLGRAQFEVRPAAEILPALSGVAAFGGLSIQAALTPKLAPALSPALAAPALHFPVLAAAAVPAAAPAAAIAAAASPAAAAEPSSPPVSRVETLFAPTAAASPAAAPRGLVSEIGARVRDGRTSAMFTGDARDAADAPALAVGRDGAGAPRLSAAALDSAAPRPAVPAPSAPRDVSTKEFFILNAVGVVGSIAAGIVFHHVLLGLLGTYAAAIPLLYGYVAFRRLRGDRINWPGVRYSPGVSWGGKNYPLFPDR